MRRDALLGECAPAYRCETVDISRHGVLLNIIDPRLAGATLGEVWNRLDTEMGGSTLIEVDGELREATIVRIDGERIGNSRVVLPRVGCRFATPLTEANLRGLSSVIS